MSNSPKGFTRLEEGVKNAPPGFTRIETKREAPPGFKKVVPATALAPAAADGADEDFTQDELDFLVGQEGMQQPPLQEQVVSKLKSREGVVNKSYLDSLGKPTGGVGHLLSKEEQGLYPEGTEIPQEVIDGWLVQDSAKAMKAAEKQAQELGVESEEMVLALSSVNFQLGPNWNKEHKNTWKLMKQGKYEEAAEEAAKSNWHEQTPTRVKDFQQALINIGE